MNLSLVNSFSFSYKAFLNLSITSGLFKNLGKFWHKFGCGNGILRIDVHNSLKSYDVTLACKSLFKEEF